MTYNGSDVDRYIPRIGASVNVQDNCRGNFDLAIAVVDPWASAHMRRGFEANDAHIPQFHFQIPAVVTSQLEVEGARLR